MPWRILIVDDEPDVREVLREYFSARGHDVTSLGSGREALDRIAQGGELFDLALVDWHMPGISGRDVVEGIQETAPGTVVLVTTGEVGATLGSRWGRGEVEIVRKPFSLRALGRRIDELLTPPTSSGPPPVAWNADRP